MKRFVQGDYQILGAHQVVKHELEKIASDTRSAGP